MNNDDKYVIMFNRLKTICKEKKRATAKEELIQYNIIKEYNGIHKFYKLRGGEFNNKYEEARYKILKWIITCATYDPENGDYSNDKNDELVKDAGKLLYEYDKMEGMRDDLVWSFIPKRYRRNIDYLWNGIGDWLC